MVCARKIRRIWPPSPPPTGSFLSERRPGCGYEASFLPTALGVHGAALPLISPSDPLKIQRARLLTRGLFNPELCGGYAPHNS